MFLGSSLGNFSRGDGAAFLHSLPLRHGRGDTLLIGLDHDNEAAKVELAYNDPKGHNRDFIMNGLKAAGNVLGDENMFDQDKWEHVGKYNKAERECRTISRFNDMLIYKYSGRHEAYYKSRSNQEVLNPATKEAMPFLADELIRVALSYKASHSLLILLTQADQPPPAYSTLKQMSVHCSLTPIFTPSSVGLTRPLNTHFGFLNAHLDNPLLLYYNVLHVARTNEIT